MNSLHTSSAAGLAVVCSLSHQLVLVSGLMHCPIASVVLLTTSTRKTHALSKRTSTTSKFLLVLSSLATRLLGLLQLRPCASSITQQQAQRWSRSSFRAASKSNQFKAACRMTSICSIATTCRPTALRWMASAMTCRAVSRSGIALARSARSRKQKSRTLGLTSSSPDRLISAFVALVAKQAAYCKGHSTAPARHTSLLPRCLTRCSGQHWARLI